MEFKSIGESELGRRRYYRLPLDPPISALLAWASGEPTEEVVLVDISEGGCAVIGRRIRTRANAPSSAARVTFRLPGEGSQTLAPVSAQIKNVSGWRLGIEFMESHEYSLGPLRRRILTFSMEQQRRVLDQCPTVIPEVPWIELMA